MKRTLDGVDVWLSVVSAGRPESVPEMSRHVGAATWYVPPDQHHDYQVQGAAALAPGSNKAVVPVRNRMLEDAFRRVCVCVQLDDDMRWASFVHDGKGQKVPAILAITALVKRLVTSDFYYGGVSPTNNPYFSRKSNSTNLFIRSHVIAVRPNPLRFDEKFPVKFDYDYTIQHYQRYGGVLRCDDLVFDCDTNSRKGGHVGDHRVAQDRAACDNLLKKWPGMVKKHPRRENEVLLTLPRRQREVLT